MCSNIMVYNMMLSAENDTFKGNPNNLTGKIMFTVKNYVLKCMDMTVLFCIRHYNGLFLGQSHFTE